MHKNMVYSTTLILKAIVNNNVGLRKKERDRFTVKRLSIIIFTALGSKCRNASRHFIFVSSLSNEKTRIRIRMIPPLKNPSNTPAATSTTQALIKLYLDFLVLSV